jgi:tRNA threonylcarbamoyl adenosine modification protein YeaZ
LSASKYGLALHTTTPELGLAISNFSGQTRSQIWNLERELSSLVHSYLMEFIKPQTWTDLAFVAVAKGPGGFTGTRVGVAIARTLGQQLNIPVFAVSTLAAIAWQRAKHEHAQNHVIAVQMAAQRNQLFAAIYQFVPETCQLNVLLADSVFTPQLWQEKLASWNKPYQLLEANVGLAATVTSILQLAYLDWQAGKRPHFSEALPYYGQHPVTT